MLFVDLYQ